jgi:hypothetical protein
VQEVPPPLELDELLPSASELDETSVPPSEEEETLPVPELDETFVPLSEEDEGSSLSSLPLPRPQETVNDMASVKLTANAMNLTLFIMNLMLLFNQAPIFSRKGHIAFSLVKKVGLCLLGVNFKKSQCFRQETLPPLNPQWTPAVACPRADGGGSDGGYGAEMK